MMDKVIIKDYEELVSSLHNSYGIRLPNGVISFPVIVDISQKPLVIRVLEGGSYCFWISSSKKEWNIPWMFFRPSFFSSSDKSGSVYFFNNIIRRNGSPAVPVRSDNQFRISMNEFTNVATQPVKELITKEILFRI
jgi:hypothetical protein